jgi:hypothetical protein
MGRCKKKVVIIFNLQEDLGKSSYKYEVQNFNHPSISLATGSKPNI